MEGYNVEKLGSNKGFGPQFKGKVVVGMGNPIIRGVEDKELSLRLEVLDSLQ